MTASGPQPTLDDVRLRTAIRGEADVKGCDIVGVFWGAFMERDRQGHQANLVRWSAEGKLSAHVRATYPLAQTADSLKPSRRAR